MGLRLPIRAGRAGPSIVITREQHRMAGAPRIFVLPDERYALRIPRKVPVPR
jgi:hypothetical protein